MNQNQFQNIISDFEKYLKKNEKIVLGLSGGQDSIALLHLLLESKLELDIYACHLNHSLRGIDSDKDQEFVEKVCKEKNIPLFVKKISIARAAKRLKIGVEETGRVLRRKFFEKICDDIKAKKILLAHHLDDQVETFFMRLLRGSSLKGLQSMNISDGKYLRPLIPYRKVDLTNFLVTRKLDWIQDESNNLTDYTRNNIRKNLIPILEKFNPNIHSTIFNTLDLISQQNQQIGIQIASIEEKIIKQVSENEYVISTKGLFSLSDFEISEMFYRFFISKIGPKDFLSYKNINDLVKMTKSENASSEFFLTKNIKIEKGYEFLFIKTYFENKENHNLNISSEGIWKNDYLTVKISKENLNNEDNYLFFELPEDGFPINVRSFQNGDRIRLRGLKSPKKLHDIFIDNKIPKFIRTMLPIFEANGTIFHIHGVDINSSYKLKSYKKNSIGISVTSKNLDELIKSTILNQKN